MSGRRGSTTISFVPRLAACLKNVAATGWLAVGVGAGEQEQVGVLRVAEDVGHRAGADALPAGPRPTRRGRGGCSDRRCWCRGPPASASGRGTPPRCEHLAEPNPARARGPCCRLDRRAAATAMRSSASSQRRLAEGRHAPRRNRRPPVLRRRARRDLAATAAPSGRTPAGGSAASSGAARAGVVPAVAALDAQPALVAGPVAALGPEDVVVLRRGRSVAQPTPQYGQTLSTAFSLRRAAPAAA